MNHKFPYQWYLKDGYPAKNIEPHHKKVFSTFACGGGSTMGYKLAGYEVIGANDIDPQMERVYKANHNPKHYFLCPVKDLLTIDLPQELYELDVLDGSPPCSTFSMAGLRGNAWGKEKHFQEGQAKQVLDDLFFDFIALVKKLQPKIVIAENVKGMLQGNAKGYILEIFKHFDDAGYYTQLFLCNAASMGVPQKRERVFFIAQRKDLGLAKIQIQFNEQPILFNEIKEDIEDGKLEPKQKYLWDQRRHSDTSLADICLRTEGKNKYFSHSLIKRNNVLPTITTNTAKQHILFDIPRHPTSKEYILGGSFPGDYQFLDLNPGYLIGMSVPPIMMAQVANQVYEQWGAKL